MQRPGMGTDGRPREIDGWGLTHDPAPEGRPLIDRRVLLLCGLSILLGVAAAAVAQLLVWLIAIITHLAFFGRFAWTEISPAENHLGLLAIIVPMIGAFLEIISACSPSLCR
jgi:hypothetical protein